ncbi:hypothetical protein [Bacillus atrophaeus]|uniref:hypothetical protein n=1 Tax=Bacillus atrophaeus TaxID=1452 RepID=UPI00280B253A|nr:hypothetical protein [Bacillus atrophaeus]
MNKDIQFLKELQNELKTQDHDSQAAPHFWSIGDYKWIRTSEMTRNAFLFTFLKKVKIMN